MSPFKFENGTLYLSGEVDYNMTRRELSSLRRLRPSRLDLTNLKRIDYASAVFFARTYGEFEIVANEPKFEKIFALIRGGGTLSLKLPPLNKLHPLEVLGKAIIKLRHDWAYFCTFLGKFLAEFSHGMLLPHKIRFRELSNYISSAGINAIFIVCLTSYLIGIVLAYQGAAMLQRFGASIFVVDIMGIMTLREVGPLIAAIVVAGRSASSYTAQIGVMKITEEIDAMKTMGFMPFRFIVVPRVLALILAMPIIVFFANSISILGQAMVCNWYMELPYGDYFERFRESVAMRHFWVGILKAPFFGAVIALIGCMRGFEVSGDTVSVGEYTTKSVVNAIFWIIALDAGFSIIYTELGV